MQQPNHWFEFNISDTEAGGVDGRALARVLDNVTNAMLAAARARLNIPARRAGRLNPTERSLAAVRVVSVLPGSVLIAFREPLPVPSAQLTFEMPVSVDDVAEDVVSEIQMIRDGAQPPPGRKQLRHAVDGLLRSASEIGELRMSCIAAVPEQHPMCL